MLLVSVLLAHFVKTYLRSTVNQDQLNHLMILNVHKTLTDGLNLILIDIANLFVEDSEHRMALFGNFKPKVPSK